MSYVLDYFRFFIWVLCQIAPWILLGFGISGIMSLFFTPERVKKHLGGTGFWPILKAVLIGVPLPLCSCGVVPVAASLRKEGASRGATAAFYVATPQIGLNSMILTFSVLGWVIGLIRPFVAFITGMLSGLVIGRLADEPQTEENAPQEEEHCCCCHKNKAPEVKKHSAFYRVMEYGYSQMVSSVAPSLLTGIAIAALIQMLVPDDFGASFLKGHAALEFIGLIVIAIPMYVCSSGAVPIAVSLMMKGFSPGAALVFMLAGPASNAAMLASMAKILGTKATVLYIVILSIVAICAGALLNMSGYTFAGAAQEANSVSIITVTQQICGAIFAALLIRAMIYKVLK